MSSDPLSHPKQHECSQPTNQPQAKIINSTFVNGLDAARIFNGAWLGHIHDAKVATLDLYVH